MFPSAGLHQRLRDFSTRAEQPSPLGCTATAPSFLQLRARPVGQTDSALRNLHLIGEDGGVSHAGAWLLAHDIRKFSVSADVACALLMGTDKTRILDRRGYYGDVYSMIDQVMTWILSKINVEYVIEHVKREERPEIPAEALREAVVNAFAHRDYRSTANVQVYIFKDRIEIVSPGGLPAGMTESDLGLRSVPRNPLLFGILHRMELVEHIGSGIRRIRDLCRDYGVPEPQFGISEYWVTTTFPRPEPESQPESQPELEPESLEHRILKVLSTGTLAKSAISASLGQKAVSGPLNTIIRGLLKSGFIEYTVPDVPKSRLQRYRITPDGQNRLVKLKEGRK